MTPFTADQKILEVGGGSQPLFRPNLDIRDLPQVDRVADLSKPWPVEDAEFDGVFSKFAMEHVSWRNVRHFTGELFRTIKPGSTAFVIIPNTEAQIRWALEQGDDWEKISQCLFGDQDYGENAHAAGFSPAFAIRLFREVGFESVAVRPFGELATDMIIEAKKGISVTKVAEQHDHGAAAWSPEERKEAYNRHYFDGGRGKVGGYSREGYWDYPVHWLTFDKIMQERPESVLELGCARGYIMKRLQDAGIRAEGLEVSQHCFLTRVCEGITTWDLTQTPWPFKDQEFDLCVSIAVLEHIPESAIDAVAAEIRRVSKRGLHGVDFGDHDDGFDKTHCLFRDQKWWDTKLNGGPSRTSYKGNEIIQIFSQTAVEKDDLEKGEIKLPVGMGLKLNCGSFRTMFHHGWTNVDVHDLDAFAKHFGYIYHRHDLRSGIPTPDDSVDLIYASHFLEHLNYQEGLAFLRECHRTMKKGSVLRLLVPDAAEIVEGYRMKGLQRFDEISDGCASTTLQAPKLCELLFSGHQALYDAETLIAILREAGFSQISEQGFRKSQSTQMLHETVDLFPELSLIVEAIK